MEFLCKGIPCILFRILNVIIIFDDLNKLSIKFNLDNIFKNDFLAINYYLVKRNPKYFSFKI